jgi:hypothetical protein
VRACLVGIVIVIGVAPGAFAQTSPPEVDQVKARQKISMMESVLESAVANGADSLMRQVRAVMPPDALMLTGAPSARGFRLEGYGVFFDVEVPVFRQTMAWTLRQMVDENGLGAANAINQIKAYIATVEDPRQRASLTMALRRLELQVGPVGPAPSDTAVRAQSGPTTVSAAVAPPAPPVHIAVIEDPNGTYTSEVSSAIVDAMLENSGPLPIAENEWLTVAARDNVRPDRLVPGDVSNISSIVFRIRGTELAAFRAGRMTLEEARKHVEIKQF